MIIVRPSAERGHVQAGWLDSRHTFSFGHYHDPAHMGFRALRVINEDRIAPGTGFGEHPHRDMEIITYVLEGGISHRDSLGNGSVIRPGEVQLMRAGTGIRHSEMNASREATTHFLQIWIVPEAAALEPAYEQRAFSREERQGRLRLVVSPDGGDGSLQIRQDARLYATTLAEGEQVTHRLAPGRHAWVQVTRGALELDGTRLAAGDGAAVSEEAEVRLVGTAEGAEALLFDLA